MALTLKTNVIANTVRRNLNQNTNAQSSTNNRLSTGRRINQAKDDAAGLAISERFTSQIRGLNQAIRNANDGISLAQVGESALSKVSGGLQRIRELAIQASNDTLSAGDRQNIQAEVDQITAGIRDVVLETEFNGTKLFSEEKSLSFQVGANQGQVIEISTADLASPPSNTGDAYAAAKAVVQAMKSVFADANPSDEQFRDLLKTGIDKVHEFVVGVYSPDPTITINLFVSYEGGRFCRGEKFFSVLITGTANLIQPCTSRWRQGGSERHFIPMRTLRTDTIILTHLGERGKLELPRLPAQSILL